LGVRLDDWQRICDVELEEVKESGSVLEMKWKVSATDTPLNDEQVYNILKSLSKAHCGDT